jgi:hypothetical protein
VDVIGRAPNAVSLAMTIAAHGRQIGMHARPDSGVEPGAAVLGAKDDVKDDLAEGLRHRRGLFECICPNEPSRAYEAGHWPARQ